MSFWVYFGPVGIGATCINDKRRKWLAIEILLVTLNWYKTKGVDPTHRQPKERQAHE